MQIRYSVDLRKGLNKKMKYIIIGFVFLWSIIFGGVGLYQYATTKTPEEYTFIDVYEFEYSHIRHEIDRSKSASGRRRTDHDYFVTYAGYVDETKLEYIAKNADTSASAESFVESNPTVNVQVFTDSEDYLVISENKSLEAFLEGEKTTGMIFAIIGSVVFVIDLIVAFFVLRKKHTD